MVNNTTEGRGGPDHFQYIALYYLTISSTLYCPTIFNTLYCPTIYNILHGIV
jgi:hypothetical protein